MGTITMKTSFEKELMQSTWIFVYKLIASPDAFRTPFELTCNHKSSLVACLIFYDFIHVPKYEDPEEP
jgi:hypothetical protein